MPQFVLHYFNAKSSGESIRTLFAYGGQEFEDRRFAVADWPALKPSMEFGITPVLEIDGKQYSQSVAISRYLGRKYGLAGATPEEDLKIDEIMDYLAELRAKDEMLKTKKKEEVMTTIVPPVLEKLDEVIRKNNGHVALGRLTWGDFVFAGVLDYLKHMMEMPDLEKKYPSFQRVIDAVYTIPKVKAFAEKAPETEFPF